MRKSHENIVEALNRIPASVRDDVERELTPLIYRLAGMKPPPTDTEKHVATGVSPEELRVELKPDDVRVGDTQFTGQQADLLRFSLLWALESRGEHGWPLVWGWAFHGRDDRGHIHNVKTDVNKKLRRCKPQHQIAIVRRIRR